MSRSPDSLRAVFLRHRPRLLLTMLLLWTTMLAGTALLGLSGGFLTAAALAGAASAERVALHAYAILDDRLYLLATPPQATALAEPFALRFVHAHQPSSAMIVELAYTLSPTATFGAADSGRYTSTREPKRMNPKR